MNGRGFAHDFEAIAKHCFHDARQKGEDTTLPLAFMGLASIAIGAFMLKGAWEQSRAAKKRDQARQGRGR